MSRVIDIRGPNGSGKTWLVRKLIHDADDVTELRGPVFADEAAPADVWAIRLRWAYRELPVYVVGPYDTAPTGGCDRIKRQDTITDRIRYLAAHGDVVFEGVITSTIFSRYSELARELRDDGIAMYTVLTLDTPMQVCLERIRERRSKRGGDPESFKVELVEDKARSVASAAAKFKEAGTADVIEGGWAELRALLFADAPDPSQLTMF